MKARLLLVPVMMFGFTSFTTAQTVEEIIEKNVAARGGAEKFAAIHSMVVKTVEEANWGGRGSSTLIIMWPDKMRFFYEWQGVGSKVPLLGNGKAPIITSIVGFDGATGWVSADQKSPTKIPSEGADLLRQTARSQFAESIGDLQANGATVDLVGRGDVDGAQCFKIRFTNHGEVFYAYYDPQSFLVVRYEIAAHQKKGKEADLGVSVGDYRNVGGILFPYTFKTEALLTNPFALAHGLPLPFAFSEAKKNWTTSTVESIEINPDVDENSFRIPGNATAEPAKR